MVEVDIVTTMGPEGTASPFTEVPTRLVNWSEAVMVTVSAWVARADTVATDEATVTKGVEADVDEGADKRVVVVDTVSVTMASELVESASDSSVSPTMTVRVPLGGMSRVMRVALGLGMTERTSSSLSACLGCLTSETPLQRRSW